MGKVSLHVSIPVDLYHYGDSRKWCWTSLLEKAARAKMLEDKKMLEQDSIVHDLLSYEELIESGQLTENDVDIKLQQLHNIGIKAARNLKTALEKSKVPLVLFRKVTEFERP